MAHARSSRLTRAAARDIEITTPNSDGRNPIEESPASSKTPVSALVFTMVLAAAVLHASWNASVKSGGDRAVSMALVFATGGLISVPFLFLLPQPQIASWSYIVASAVIHALYGLALARMLDSGDLSQTYPIARGLAPIMIFILAAVFADERHSPSGIAAIALISAGIISLSVVGRPKNTRGGLAIAQAVLVGLLIALYSYIDGQGVRLSGDAFAYIAWIFFLTAILILPAAMATCRRAFYLALAHSLGGGCRPRRDRAAAVRWIGRVRYRRGGN